MRSPWVYVVAHRKDGKVKQREFDSEAEARGLVDRLKRNREEYTFARARRKRLWEIALETQIRWLGFRITVMALSIATVVLAGAFLLWVQAWMR